MVPVLSHREGRTVFLFDNTSNALKTALFSTAMATIAFLSVPSFAQDVGQAAGVEAGDSGGALTLEDGAKTGMNAKPVYGPSLPVSAPSKTGFVIDWEGAPLAAAPALVTALDLISRNYPSIRGARSGIKAAESEIKGAKWQRFPSLSLETSVVDSGNTVAPSVTVSAPIWSAGRISSTINRANAGLDAAQARYRETVLGLAVDATQLYFDIARLARREALIQESLGEHRALVGSMERRVAQEVSPLADLELARSRLAQIEQELTIARAQRQASLFAFAELVADPSYDIGNVPDYIEGLALQNPDRIIEEALNYDPSLQRLSAEIQAGKAEAAAAKSSLFPQLNGQYSYNEIVGSRVGVVARLETSAGLSRFSAVSAARARLDTLTAQFSTAQRQIRQRLNNDMTEFDAARARAAVSRNASFTANNVSQSYMRQFIAGRRSWLDVMNSLRETLSARLGQADAEILAMSSYVRISLRTGRWSPFVDNSK